MCCPLSQNIFQCDIWS